MTPGPFLKVILFFWLPLQIPELENSVRVYWDALSRLDRVEAMKYVHPSDLNQFLNRAPSLIGGWELGEISMESETLATVRLRVTRNFFGRFQAVPTSETWEKTEDGWKVSIQPIEQQFAKLTSFQKPPLPERLDVFPKQLRFYAMAPQQPGVLVIRNGLKVDLEIVGLQVDSARFRLPEFTPKVAARSVVRIPIRYAGKEKKSNLKSELRLQIRIGEEIRDFGVPIVYNYTDRVMEWIRQKKGAGEAPDREEK